MSVCSCLSLYVSPVMNLETCPGCPPASSEEIGSSPHVSTPNRIGARKWMDDSLFAVVRRPLVDTFGKHAPFLPVFAPFPTTPPPSARFGQILTVQSSAKASGTEFHLFTRGVIIYQVRLREVPLLPILLVGVKGPLRESLFLG